MRVILLTDIPGVGHKYDVKKVASGYAANFLIPQKKAEPATKSKVEALELKRAQIEEEQKLHQELLAKNVEALKGVVVTLSAEANDQGHLYKGVHEGEILKALREQAHIELPEGSLQLEHPIKEVGEHTVSVVVDGEEGSFTLNVSSLKV